MSFLRWASRRISLRRRLASHFPALPCSAHPHLPLRPRDAATVVPRDEPEPQGLAARAPSGNPAVVRLFARLDLVFEDSLRRVVLHHELLLEAAPQLVSSGFEAL